MIYVARISEDGLSKIRFGFELSNSTLQYVEYYTFFRDATDELWGDQWSAPLSYEKWCASHNIEACTCEHDCCCLRDQYESYRDTLNPCCHKTKDGKVKMMGQWCMMINALPACPDEVAAEALAFATKSLTVRWK